MANKGKSEKSAAPVGVVRDEIFIEHHTDRYHPESPERLERIYEMLDSWAGGKNLTEVPTRKAEREELLRIHSNHHVETVANTARMDRFYLDGDTPTSPKSYEAALFAAGSGIEMVDYILDGKISSGFALVRPPGHHAESDRAMGFCLFNNIAVAAAHARDVRGLKRILIVDWDLHHGNGTQHSFYSDNRVLYFSTHQYPYYPGTGHYQDVGQGAGTGYSVNLPFPPGQADNEYMAAFIEILEPVAKQFKPDLVLVSAGFDTYVDDPLGHMGVTADGYGSMTALLKRIAGEHCGGKIAFFLEGGYNLDGLVKGVRRVLEVLMGTETPPISSKVTNLDERFTKYLETIKENLRSYWDTL